MEEYLATDTIRLSSSIVNVSWEHGQRLYARLEAFPGGKSIPDTLRRHPAIFTELQKPIALACLEAWLEEEGVDGLGPELFALRNALHDDLDEKGAFGRLTS